MFLLNDELAQTVTKIINTSLDIDKSFNSSRIRPLIKPNLDQDILTNYRPVSNLPFISKIKAVDVRIESHMKTNDLHILLTESSILQKLHFWKSIMTFSTHLINTLWQSLWWLISQTHSTLLIMKMRIHRLENHFGIAAKPLSCTKSYLSDRFQTVCINSELSRPVLMKYRVSQGSVLGSKNYTMYTKHVGAIRRTHELDNHFYADDAQLYLSFKSVNAISIEETIDRVQTCLMDIYQHADTQCRENRTNSILIRSYRSSSLQHFGESRQFWNYLDSR